MGALQDWTSLEIAKLVASLATPIVVACLGFWISRKVRESDRRFNEARDERKKAARPRRGRSTTSSTGVTHCTSAYRWIANSTGSDKVNT